MKRRIIAIALCIVISLSAFATGFELDTYEKNSEYLAAYFGIELSKDSVSFSEFAKALSTVTGKAVDTPADSVDLIRLVVVSSGLEEFAKTYSDAKTSSRLELYNVAGDNYTAAALDAKILSADLVSSVLSSAFLSAKDAASLLMAVANATGNGRNYIGFVSDDDILAKIENTFKNVGLYENDELDVIGALLVETGASTGYNLKRESDDARFLPSLTIRYGHDDLVHVKQLVGVLASEGIDALIQIEPKTSIYEYMLEWGPVPEPSDTYRVEQFSENLYLVYAVEFDIEFEFDTLEDLVRFDAVINQYSKKNDVNQAANSGINLIRGAWWQPLYSAIFNPDESAYTPIIDNILYSGDGKYSIHPYTTIEDSPALIEIEQSLSDGGYVEADYRYVNNAFYRYLIGSDYQ